MPELVIGAFGPAAASRKHAFDGTEWLAILSVTGAGAAAMASVGVYVSETDARAVATHVSATATTAATQAAHDAAQGRRKEPTKNLNSRMLRFCAADFGNFDGTKPYGAPAPASPLVGKSFKHLVSVLDSTGTVTLDLKEFVVSVVSMHASVADAFNCEYSQGGTTHNIVLGKAIIEAALVGAASPPPPRVTVAVVEVVVGTPLIKLVRALPYSKMAAAGHVDALEAVELVKAAGIALPLDDPTDAGFTVGITAALSQLTTILNRAPPRTWPDTAASRLGAELKKEAATPGGGAAASSSFTSSRHMLAEALKQLASSEAEWSLFLGKSIMVTVDSTRLAAAAASDYIKMGALDAYLKRAAATASSIHACGALGSLDSDELVAIIMFELQPAAPSVGAALSSAAKPVQVSVMQNDLTGSSDERRLRLALREDYEKLDGDSAAKAELEKLHSLVANPVELAAKVRDLSDGNGLKRLVSTENDVERSLAGAPSPRTHTTQPLSVLLASSALPSASSRPPRVATRRARAPLATPARLVLGACARCPTHACPEHRLGAPVPPRPLPRAPSRHAAAENRRAPPSCPLFAVRLRHGSGPEDCRGAQRPRPPCRARRLWRELHRLGNHAQGAAGHSYGPIRCAASFPPHQEGR